MNTTIENKRSITSLYKNMQVMPAIEKAWETYPLPPASAQGLLRATFQATEIALWNIADLMTRATKEIKQKRFGSAYTKMAWARGFQGVLVKLSMIPNQLGLVCSPGSNGSFQDCANAYGILRIADSPGFQEYTKVLKRFDRQLSQAIESAEFPLESLLSSRSLESNRSSLIHLIRICNHETTIWERNLSEVFIPGSVPSYEEFVVAKAMREVVFARVIPGDTYFTQFRGLQQITEILGSHINDRLEQAIVKIKAQDLPSAYEHLRCIHSLTGGVITALLCAGELLTVSDYQTIERNLELTSGNQALSLHYHLFEELYEQLWLALVTHILGCARKTVRDEEIQRAIRQVDQKRFTGDQEAFLSHLLANQCLQLRVFVQQWRDQSLHNLGNNNSKNFNGAKSVAKQAQTSCNIATFQDPMQPLANARYLRKVPANNFNLPLTFYCGTPSSLERKITDTMVRINSYHRR